jgi:protein tyrosine/serine phosphatase
MAKHLISRDLVPFRQRRNGYRLPKIETEREEEIREQMDSDLEPEEETFILHYLRYADLLLASYEAAAQTKNDDSNIAESNNVVELPLAEDIKKDAA